MTALISNAKHLTRRRICGAGRAILSLIAALVLTSSIVVAQ